MKKFIFILCALLICSVSHAQTETMNWYVDGETYATTQCESGGDVILPTAPTKRGYTFEGWGAKYTRVQYIESTGTQYIDTGIVPTSNTGVKIKAQFTGYIGHDFDTIIGRRGDRNSDESRYYPFTATNQGAQFRSGMANEYYTFTFDTNVHTIDFNTDAHKIYIDERLVKTLSSATLSGFDASIGGGSIYLFATHLPDDYSDSGGDINPPYAWRGAGKIYYVKIYDNNVLVRDLVPVLDPYDVPCMYDKVSGMFFYNSGTGDFIAGSTIELED